MKIESTMHARIFQTTCNEQIICQTTVLRHQTKLKTYRMFTIQILYLYNPIQKTFFKKTGIYSCKQIYWKFQSICSSICGKTWPLQIKDLSWKQQINGQRSQTGMSKLILTHAIYSLKLTKKVNVPYTFNKNHV